MLEQFKTSVGDAYKSVGERVTGASGGGADGGGTSGGGTSGGGGSAGETNSNEGEQFLLSDDLKTALIESMKELGFPLEDTPGRIWDYSQKCHSFYRAPVKGGYLAFLYAGNNVLASNNNGNNFFWMGTLFTKNGAVGIYIFSDAGSLGDTYETLAETWEEQYEKKGLKRAHFFDKGHVELLIKGDSEIRKNKLQEWLKLDKYTAVAQSSSQNLTIENLKGDHEKQERIVSIITNAAENYAGPTPQGYIHDLISRTNWPGDWKLQLSGLWEGNSEATARKLVGWALSRKINKENQDYTTIGGLLETLIRGDTDLDDGKELFKMIQDYALITDQDAIQKIQDKCFH